MRVLKSLGELSVIRDLRIVDFRIVEGAATVVEYIVQQSIKDGGWQPFGSVSVAMMGSVPICAQALVKYEEPVTEQPTNEGDKP